MCDWHVEGSDRPKTETGKNEATGKSQDPEKGPWQLFDILYNSFMVLTHYFNEDAKLS